MNTAPKLHIETLRKLIETSGECYEANELAAFYAGIDALERLAALAPPSGEGVDKDGWPDYLMLRDTKLHDDMGGLGQRIFTTAGAGYKKVKYVRADLVTTPQSAPEE